MDKSDSRLHCEQIEKLMSLGRYQEAVYLVDKVDWRKEEDNKRLIQAAEVYRKNRRYDDAANILKMAHNKKPNNKKIVFLLCETYFESKDVVTAQVYLERYQSMTDRNDWHYDALKYKRALAYDLPVSEKIDILEELVKKEPAAEEFRFELANMYSQGRQYAECGAECDEIVLLFGDDGTYARKALELKQTCIPLTAEQNSLLRRLSLGEDVSGENKRDKEAVKLMNTMDMSTIDLESHLANDIASMQKEDVVSGRRRRPDFNTKSLQQTIPPSTQEIFYQDRTEDIHFTEEIGTLSGYNVKPNDNDIREVSMSRNRRDEDNPMNDLLYREDDGQIAISEASSETNSDNQADGQVTMDALLSDWTKIKERNTQNLRDNLHKDLVERTGKIFGTKKVEIEEEIEEPGSIWKEVELGDEFDEDSFENDEELEENVEVSDVNDDEAEATLEEEGMAEASEVTEATPEEETEEESVSDASDEAVDENDNEEEETSDDKAIEDEGVEIASEEDSFDREPDAAEEESDNNDNEDEEEQMAGKDLSPEERKLFAPFLYSRQMKAQIIYALDNISMASYVGNVIVTTDNKESGFALAKSMVKFIKYADTNFSGAMSRVPADKFNTKDAVEILDKLNNGALVIEDANKLTNNSLIRLTQGINQEERGIVIFLVDTRKEMKKLLTRQTTLTNYFNIKIDIIAMNEDALVDYGAKYANNLGYSLEDGFASLAFHKRVREAQAGNHIVTVAEVKEIVDGAIERNDKGLFGKIGKKKRDDNGMILLKEKDFS